MSSHGPRCETKILQRNGACCGRESGLVHAGAPPSDGGTAVAGEKPGTRTGATQPPTSTVRRYHRIKKPGIPSLFNVSNMSTTLALTVSRHVSLWRIQV